MVDRDLEEIINEEIITDKSTSDVLRFSADIKKKMRLVKDENGIEIYYLNISPKNKNYINKIMQMGHNEVDRLYMALKHPILFVDLKDKTLRYFCENFNRLNLTYTLKTDEIEDKQIKKLSDIYFKSEEVDSKEDLKYANMFDVSYKIKSKGVKFIVSESEMTAGFYLTELESLGSEGQKVIDYLSSLKSDDAAYFTAISGNFSLVDTNKKVLYTMKNSSDKEGRYTVKLSVIDDKSEYDYLEKLLNTAKQIPMQKAFLIEQPETYNVNSKPPSDMYL